jgi:hypothetical protein
MADAPLVLVHSRDSSIVTRVVKSLKGKRIPAYGTTSLDAAIDAMDLHQPKVLVADPATEHCSALLDRSGGWKSISLAAIAESGATAKKARKMGIRNVIASDDTEAIVAAVVHLLQQ